MSDLKTRLLSFNITPYSDNAGYRQLIRNFFNFTENKYSNYAGEQMSAEYIDNEECRDELLFDDDQMKVGIDYLYDNTIANNKFKQLYISAAGGLLSEDPAVGQIVLCSYDNLFMYLWLCKEFFSETEVDNQKQTLFCNEYSIKLFKKFKIL